MTSSVQAQDTPTSIDLSSNLTKDSAITWTGSRVVLWNRLIGFSIDLNKGKWFKISQYVHKGAKPVYYKPWRAGKSVVSMPLSKSEVLYAFNPDNRIITFVVYNCDSDTWTRLKSISIQKPASKLFPLRKFHIHGNTRYLFTLIPPEETIKLKSLVGDESVVIPWFPVSTTDSLAIHSLNPGNFLWGHRRKSMIGYIWKLPSDTWDKLPLNKLTPCGLRGFASFKSNDDIYFYGGHSTWSSSIGIGGYVRFFKIISSDNTWSRLRPNSSQSWWDNWHVYHTKNGVFILGSTGGSFFNSDKNTFTSASEVNAPSLSRKAISVFTGKEIVFVNIPRTKNGIINCYSYSIDLDRWKKLPSIETSNPK
jgi:hypothetical protein